MRQIFSYGLFIYLFTLLVLFYDHSNLFVYWAGILSASGFSGIILGTTLGNINLPVQTE